MDANYEKRCSYDIQNRAPAKHLSPKPRYLFVWIGCEGPFAGVHFELILNSSKRWWRLYSQALFYF